MMHSTLYYLLVFALFLLGYSSCKESPKEGSEGTDVLSAATAIDIESSFKSKLDLLSEKLGEKLSVQDVVEAIIEGEFADDEVYFFLGELSSDPAMARETDLQFIYYYLGGRDHHRILHYYFTQVVHVKVTKLEDSGIVFPDQEEDDYTIHQERRLLSCAVAGWYHSAAIEERGEILQYVNLLAKKFNNVIRAKDMLFFKMKNYRDALENTSFEKN